jgi:imidazoleglycerol-phosphate dehydratase
MLELFSRHGLFDLTLEAKGDIEVDYHHLIEDIGIVLGQALKEAAGDKEGMARYGSQFVPMDEALVQSVVDFGGRAYLDFTVTGLEAQIKDFSTELIEEFLRAVVYNAGMNLHIRQISGENTHHILEAVFKSFGRALNHAVKLEEDINGVMSTKGKL